ncbi:hypothetical protein BESB_021560 [Besnoitia besnoiti]|uniref:Uncharacterized protein n=1 Tax=Besnoitia besnoiti TaxID=94643 RepID=A0A2A9M2L9_BESBE|nr:hypothetical protein BESB_021560 [Besnoitia besnoiti]PFH32215.1 hypothetical protein BESB_021560 [Besnoitia besnoiti]
MRTLKKLTSMLSQHHTEWANADPTGTMSPEKLTALVTSATVMQPEGVDLSSLNRVLENWKQQISQGPVVSMIPGVPTPPQFLQPASPLATYGMPTATGQPGLASAMANFAQFPPAQYALPPVPFFQIAPQPGYQLASAAVAPGPRENGTGPSQVALSQTIRDGLKVLGGDGANMQAKKMRSPKHLKADATPGEATKKIAELSADHSVCDAGRDELSRRCSDMKTKKRARCQQELGADAAPASPPQRDRNRPAGSGSKEGSQPSSCCILLTHCPLYLYRDRRHSSTAGLLNLDEHKYMLAGDPSASSHAEAFSFPFLDKIQAQLRQLHQPVQRCRNGHGDAVGAQTRGMAAASEAARRNALALAEDRRLLLEASMRSDVVHQCLLNILDSIVVSQLRTGVPHFASGADARETAKVWKRQAGAKESPTPAHSSGVHLDILLHTLDGKLLRVSPSFRVPRNFKVFKKVASMALSSPTGKLCATPTARTEKCRRHGWGSAEKDRAQADDEDSAEEDRQAGSLPEEEETLIEVLQPPFWRHLPEQFSILTGGYEFDSKTCFYLGDSLCLLDIELEFWQLEASYCAEPAEMVLCYGLGYKA